ncbi:MAG: M48 family metallopeptidase [Deltaproteobacteria bacterium]|nr:M48 family metallopeptidase [Deltaproteobacteria bacterium]
MRSRLFCLGLALFLVGCASVPHTGRRQLNIISDSQMNALALQALKQVLEKERESEDQRMSSIVRRVADRVSKAAEATDKPGFDWEVRLIEKDTPNAFCLPGGKVIVFTGILPYARNEAGLAAIIGHEVAHAVARHGGERLSQQLALRGALVAGNEILKKKDGSLDSRSRMILAALGLGGAVGVILPYSRVHELEADQISQVYMARAGYDPSEAVKVWRNMSKIKKPPIPVWLSTHPADDERIKKLEEHLSDAQKQYAEAPVKLGRGSPL